MEIDRFRDVLEIPKTYTLGRINDKPSKAELEKKKIDKFPEETKGKGRRKIEKIEIYFAIYEDIPKKKKSKLTLEEEMETREILQNQGIGYEILNEQKKKSPSIYIKTLKSVLKK